MQKRIPEFQALLDDKRKKRSQNFRHLWMINMKESQNFGHLWMINAQKNP
jgi:hypothetical protein